MVVERFVGSAAAFHARPIPVDGRPAVWVHEVDRPAVVLGSGQRGRFVDEVAAAAAGVEVVRRRSGGGAVWLAPGEVAWVDVILPANGPGWGVDVHTPMRWLGEVIAAAVGRVAGPGRFLSVNVGPMRRTRWSELICFDGLGPGEVSIDGVKLVGISQRRTREAARLQCCWYHRYAASDLLRWLAPPDGVVPTLGELTTVAVAPRHWTPVVVAAIADAVAPSARR